MSKGDRSRYNLKKYGNGWDEIFGLAMARDAAYAVEAKLEAKRVAAHKAWRVAEAEKLAKYLMVHRTQRKHRRRRNDRVK